jgi:transcriptional regulator GlxA family with amidase domain
MHKTPVQYLLEVRIARAKTLLKDTEHEIISICFEVGFENVSTFYRSFKQSTGLTPHQYRTQNK